MTASSHQDLAARYAPPQASLDLPPPVASEPAEPMPLGGWLWLVLLGLVVTPFRLVYQLFTVYWPVFRDGHWAALTDPAQPAYHALWGPLIGFEIAGHVVLMAISMVALALFLGRRRRTPAVMITLYLVAVAYVLLDLVLARLIPAVAAQSGADSMQEVVRAGLAALIWIPYFRVSKRVKATFVR